MVDAFVRDYLLERIEMALDHRALTGYYPRLSLAPGQRFASKGGYVVRFVDAQGTRVAPLGEWTTPWKSRPQSTSGSGADPRAVTHTTRRVGSVGPPDGSA